MISLIFDKSRAHLVNPTLYRQFYNVEYEPGEVSVARPGEPRLQWAVQHIPLNSRVLDVGCYKGSVAIPLWGQRHDLDITGVDISVSAISDAKEFAEVLEAPISFRVATAENLPFGDGEFDAVLLFEIMEHVPDPCIVLAEAQRVAASGGVILISSPVEAERLESYSHNRIPGFECLRQHVREYDPVVELAGKPGLTTCRGAGIDRRFSYHLAMFRSFSVHNFAKAKYSSTA